MPRLLYCVINRIEVGNGGAAGYQNQVGKL
jgi:hypothetical protein